MKRTERPADADLDGQHARFRALVLPHLDRLLGFAVRRTDAASDAEDAVQEACLRAWSAFGDLRDEERVRAWLFRILRTVLSDVHDKEGRRRQLVSITRLEEAHEAMVGSDAEFVFADVVARIDREHLEQALSEIPDDFATAVMLHDIEGFKYHEIATITDVPIGTVMSRISRGRRLLAGAMTINRAAWPLGVEHGVAAPRRATLSHRNRK